MKRRIAIKFLAAGGGLLGARALFAQEKLAFDHRYAAWDALLKRHVDRVARLPMEAWVEDVRLENRYNRLVVYRAGFVHSATRYFGRKPKARSVNPTCGCNAPVVFCR